jgi:hypothetical protein
MRRLILLVAGISAAAALAVTTPAAGAPAPGGERLALLIGVDVHQGPTRTNLGSVGDVEDMRALLQQSGWRPENIRVLTNAAATAEGIREGLQWLASRSTDTSFSVISYSGHVKQVGSTEYLWPHDNAHIPDTEFAAAVRAVRGWSWVHLSGCEAAGFDEGLSSPTRLVTFSSLATEKSYELPAEVRNSVFTNLLVDQGMLRKQADFNRDGRVSIQEAFRHAAQWAPQITSGQAQGPQHPVIAGGDGTEWFLNGPGLDPYVSSRSAPKLCIFFICL